MAAAAAQEELGALERACPALLPRPLPRGRDLRAPRAFPRAARARLEAAAGAAAAAAAAVGGAGAGCQVCGAAGASGGGAGALALGLEWELDFVAGSMRPRGAVMLCSECEAAGDLPGMLNLGVAAAGGSSECRDVQRRLMAHLAQVNGVPAQGVGGTSGRRDQEDASEVWAHEVLNRAHALRVLASAAAWDLQMPEGGLEAFVSRELRERWQARAGGRGGGAETPPPGSMKNKKRKGPRGDTPQPRRSARKAQRAQ